MNLNIAICDDDLRQAEYIKNIVTDWSASSKHPAEVFTFPSAEAFLFEYSENKNFDILLLDIEMGKMNGIELAKRLRAGDCEAQIVFITGYPDFIAEGYEVSAVHYLMKPIKPEKLSEVLNRAIVRMEQAPRYFLFSSGKESFRIHADSIYYAESDGHYVVLHTSEGEYRFRMTVPELESHLDSAFYRCSRSFIVGLKYVTRITKTSVILENGMELPLGKGQYDDINLKLIQYLRTN